MSESVTMQGLACPLPLAHTEKIVLGHGSGGKLSHDLIKTYFLPAFDNPALRAGNDAGIVTLDATRLAISADSHVVAPLFFPGGDIGKLAVCGTVNDLAMMGATPLYLTAGFILEEGLDMALLARVAESMRDAARAAQVQIVAGDTKVVQRGKADGLYISTAGVGVLRDGVNIHGANAQPGDAVILSGTLGDHGIAVLSARGDLGFDADVVSDIAPLNELVAAILETGAALHVLRDPTRGGVATTLNEIAQQSNVGIVLREDALPIRPAVAAACEMLGFDPLYIANEGKLLAVVASQDAERVLRVLRAHKYGADAALIGIVQAEPRGRVLLKTSIGSARVVDVLMGELLPRIC
ncbi:MAG: hydrogenase expression/formation protein HypE [Chloroflexi bacterium]|nr:MAG: hydrogenase expression/formation protein HypE [Chloroflexota bacterium]